MEEITPIFENFKDGFTKRIPFDQITNSQDDQEYDEDPLELKNIHGSPQGANNKNKKKEDPSRSEIIESQSKRRGRPLSNVTSTTTSR
ncbi:hypothetical protein O181_014153 [Austropuccinia psidii MF-1]|uniref:Uncharacterized protein n=1 Tax=Austropuccinia psidii MF-1 TaxID=1389203 RepID=A0A9Q3C010_9BASI|nr:hypothetical protein [Austropuccinia psidii MF-1]